jgi:hypothetical protein
VTYETGEPAPNWNAPQMPQRCLSNELPREFWIVVTQWDTDPQSPHVTEEYPARGPLVHEGFCHSEEHARAYADRLRGRYGWAVAVKVHAPEGVPHD